MLSIFCACVWSKRICATAQFFPTHCQAPLTTITNHVLIAANEIIKAIKNPLHIFTKNLHTDHFQSLKRLRQIFSKAEKSTQPAVAPSFLVQQPTHVFPQLIPPIPVPLLRVQKNTPEFLPQQDSSWSPPPRTIIPFDENELPSPEARPPTHQYPTLSCG